MWTPTEGEMVLADVRKRVLFNYSSMFCRHSIWVLNEYKLYIGMRKINKSKAPAITLPDHSAVYNVKCGRLQGRGVLSNADKERGVGKRVIFCIRPIWTTP